MTSYKSPWAVALFQKADRNIIVTVQLALRADPVAIPTIHQLWYLPLDYHLTDRQHGPVLLPLQ